MGRFDEVLDAPICQGNDCESRGYFKAYFSAIIPSSLVQRLLMDIFFNSRGSPKSHVGRQAQWARPAYPVIGRSGLEPEY